MGAKARMMMCCFVTIAMTKPRERKAGPMPIDRFVWCCDGGKLGEHTDDCPLGQAAKQLKDQPPPKPNDNASVWDLVIADMAERDRVGRERYGTPLQPHNGRDALIDAYQEALDLVVYLRQAIEERG